MISDTNKISQEGRADWWGRTLAIMSLSLSALAFMERKEWLFRGAVDVLPPVGYVIYPGAAVLPF
jgi:hypothetical protein